MNRGIAHLRMRIYTLQTFRRLTGLHSGGKILTAMSYLSWVSWVCLAVGVFDRFGPAT